MAQQSLLAPRATTPFLREFEQAIAYEPRIAEGIDAIRDIKGRRLPSWLQFLLYEYGLIELTPYVPNPYSLLRDGRQWQIERDTFAAVDRGLGWVSSPGRIDEAPAKRIWWNSFQLFLENLPFQDVPDLNRIEKIVSLSAPYRSDFRRGVHGYDAPALAGDSTRLDASLLDTESGVRIRAGGALWSFGRVLELEHLLQKPEGVALGNWIEHVADAGYAIDLAAMTAEIDGSPIPIGGAMTFSRPSQKWAQNNAGAWIEFGVDQIASTDQGALLEVAADRLSLFAPQINYLAEAQAAVVTAAGRPDPFGGNKAIRVEFTADAGRTLLVPTIGLQPYTTYSVSFFARLISGHAISTPHNSPGFQDVFGQLVKDKWVRVNAASFKTGSVAGDWLDLTLSDPGAAVTVELFGFQVEAGNKVSSPIGGDAIPATRAADSLTLLLPTGLNSLVARFKDSASQSFLEVVGDLTLDPADLNGSLLLGVATATASTWENMAFPWEDANFPWAGDAITQRQVALASSMNNRSAYIGLRDDQGQIIGYRRARTVRQVDIAFNGVYSFKGSKLSPATGGTSILIEAMTQAGNGASRRAAAFEAVFDPVLAAGVPAGKLWLEPADLVSGVPVAATAIDLSLRATVRERIKLLLRF